ncbi:MAG: 2-oxoglutarate dehydrogenase E1 component, partial [Alphaproteobacteria bacterium]|nr:2-oxoglutarate dehydrogenase E1 component [Alphaproteobacteria bacterium]
MASPHAKDDRTNEIFEATSFLNGANAGFVEDMYARFQADPSSVDESWRTFFASIAERMMGERRPSWARKDWPEPADETTRALTAAAPYAKAEPKGSKPALRDSNVRELQQTLAQRAPALTPEEERRAVVDTIRATQMIRAYRVRGHLEADLDPLRLTKRAPHPELHPESYGFGPNDLDRPIFIDGMLGLERATVRQMLDILRKTYCDNIGIQFMHIAEPEEKSWLQQRVEGAGKDITFTPEGKKAIL